MNIRIFSGPGQMKEDPELSSFLGKVYESSKSKQPLVDRLSSHPSVLDVVPASRRGLVDEVDQADAEYEDGWIASFVKHGPKIVVYRVFLARGNGSIVFMIRGDGHEAFKSTLDAELLKIRKPLSPKAAQSQTVMKVRNVMRYQNQLENTILKAVGVMRAAQSSNPVVKEIGIAETLENLKFLKSIVPSLVNPTKEAFILWADSMLTISPGHISTTEGTAGNVIAFIAGTVDNLFHSDYGKSISPRKVFLELKDHLTRPEVDEKMLQVGCDSALLDFVLAT